MQGQDRFDPLGLDQYSAVLLSATCQHPPVPPGLHRFPQPGEVYLSPALAALRHTNARVAVRFPHVTGVMGRAGLTDASELYAVIGVKPLSGDLPIGVWTFDRFGSANDFVATDLRISRTGLLALGLLFTMIPAAYLIGVCARLNARTRERQLRLLSILGLGAPALRGALMAEAALTVGSGAVVGVVVAAPLLARITPRFVEWTAFPGDFSPRPGQFLLVVALVIALAVVAAAVATRPVTRRGERAGSRRRWLSPVGRGIAAGWRWGVLTVGLLSDLAYRWLPSSGTWIIGLTLLGRIATCVGVLVVTRLCAPASVGA